MSNLQNRPRRKIDRLIILVIGLIVSFLAFLPMLSAKGICDGSDITFHLARIESMADAMRMHVFPVKIHFTCEFGFGYGSGFFYPNCLLYFPAILMVLGLSLDSAFKIFIFGIFLLMFYSAYISLYMVTKNKIASIIATSLLVLSTPLFFSIYSMFSVGNYTAMIFMIPAICGMWGSVQIKGNNGKFQEEILLGYGFLGLFLTHTLSFFFCVLVCAIILLFSYKNWLGDKTIILRIIIVAISVILMSAAYWMPMLEQFGVQKYKVSLPYINPSNSYSNLLDIATSGRYGIFTFLLTAVALLLLFFMLVRQQRDGVSPLMLFAIQLMTLSVFGVLLTCSKWFWKQFGNQLMFIQVPARLLNVTLVCLIIAVAIIIAEWEMNDGTKIWAGIALIAMSFLTAISYLPSDLNDNRVSYVNKRITDSEYGDGDGGMEWLPLKCGRNFEEPNKAYADDGSGADGIKEKLNTEYKVWLLTSKQWYDIPYVYYKGYHAYLEDGQELKSDVNHSTGLFRVYIPENIEDEVITVNVKYIPTTIQKISYIVSVISMILLAVLWYRKQRNIYKK